MSTRLHQNKEALALFILMLRRNAPATMGNTLLCDYAATLIKAAKTLHTMANIACDRELTARDDGRIRSAKKAAYQAAKEIFGSSAKIETNSGDPRAAGIKLYPPDGSTNSWDGESYPVPLV